MDPQHFKAYLNLIQELLSCPRGEEWILLRQNENLVNPELIEVMEQVAHYLAAEGHINGARYLHNWAGKLHHILSHPVTPSKKPEDKTLPYRELIQALLNAPESAAEQILSANQALVNPELVKHLKEVADQFTKQGDISSANFLNQLATNINRTWLQTHDFQPNLEKANQLAPDPWDDETVESPPKTPSRPVKKPSAKLQQTESPPPTPAHETTSQFSQQLSDQLLTIAHSLEKLEKTLATHLKASNPLEYLSVLEQAAASQWIISSQEVEQLIGVKPQCKKGETSYRRGNWLFVKAGKLGNQTGWRVEKMTP